MPTQYEQAMALAVSARALRESISTMRAAPDEDSHPHSPTVSAAVRRGLDTSGLEAALAAFETTLYQALPDIRGEHDLRLYTARLAAGSVRFHGNVEGDFYAVLRDAARVAGFEWREFEVGIGAAGIEIVVAFGAHVAAGVIYEFLRKVAEKGLDPAIDAETAVQLCKADLSRRRNSCRIGAAYALASPVSHARFEVYLHDMDADCVHLFLVRKDGEICGRKDRRLVDGAAG